MAVSSNILEIYLHWAGKQGHHAAVKTAEFKTQMLSFQFQTVWQLAGGLFFVNLCSIYKTEAVTVHIYRTVMKINL